MPTLSDIAKELEKPGRDIRDDLPAPNLRTDVMDINDLKDRALQIELFHSGHYSLASADS